MDDTPAFRPSALDPIMADAAARGFIMSCEDRTGAMLSILAASKPGARILELGTGVGAGASWLLHGMNWDATLLTVEKDAAVQSVAAKHLGADRRISFELADADAWLDSYRGPPFALAYADCFPGKFRRMEDLLRLLEPGGLYVVDDLLPQTSWPAGHGEYVDAFLFPTPAAKGLIATPMHWASGLLIGARICDYRRRGSDQIQ